MAVHPLVVSCQGGSPVSQLAAEIAGGLESLGLADRVADTESWNAEAAAHREMIALDGCASACSSRLAVAKGVRLVASLNLAELGVVADALDEVDRAALVVRATERLRIGSAPHPPARHYNVGQEKPPPSGRAHSVDDYLLAIDALATPVVECGALMTDAPTLASHVSTVLGVSRPSAGEMLARMEASGIVQRGTRKELLLTPNGRIAADAIVRRHRVLELFATTVLGYTIAESHDRARSLDGAFDEESIERLHRSLGYPERCPHGWPIDPLRAREESRELHTLASLSSGEEARVMRLAEHDNASLRRLAQLDIVPGTIVIACARSELGEQHYTVGGHDVELSGQESTAVFVRRA